MSDFDDEHFLGLLSIYALTADRSRELLVLLEDADGIEAYEWYEKFAISDYSESFALNTLGKANGTAGDSLSHHFGQKFSSFDQYYGPDSSRNCAKIYHSAWWFSSPCHQSNLGGNYGNNTLGMGINWMTFRSHEHSLKLAAMMIRPRPGYRQ
ncbi:ficolin-1-like [Drosophila nasuta]|uniref:ficolin-1-like n=1 Tax=Drosophila nasuta TaxID=42062 RepID=UPI00295E494C|nr:ficolin-1-like [Drosophila nasuta]